MKISIIIPMYNVEHYIERCLRSVITNENWGSVEYEILVIDDQSLDNSLSIATEISLLDNNIKIISQKNKGLGGARNTGIKNATGDYLLFLDSDDYVDLESIEKISNIISEENIEVLEFTAHRVDSNNKIIQVIRGFDSLEVMAGQDYLLKYGIVNSACNKLYSRKFLEINNIYFVEKIFVEDLLFNIEVYLKAVRVKCISNPIAYFYQSNNSITRVKRTNKVIEQYLLSYQIIFPKLKLLIDEYSNSNRTQLFFYRVLSFNLAGALLMLLRSNWSYMKKQQYIVALNELKLYPFTIKTEVFIRDFFISIINNKKVFNLLLRFSCVKIIRTLVFFPLK